MQGRFSLIPIQEKGLFPADQGRGIGFCRAADGCVGSFVQQVGFICCKDALDAAGESRQRTAEPIAQCEGLGSDGSGVTFCAVTADALPDRLGCSAAGKGVLRSCRPQAG